MIISNFYMTTLKGRKLIENLNLIVNNGDKLAIIGEEGDGKSSFVKAICDEQSVKEYATFGGDVQVETPIGYLHQFLSKEWNDLPVSDYFLKDDPNDEIDYDRYEDFSSIMKLFPKFGLSADLFMSEQKIGTLSGGEKVKLQLIKITNKRPSIYIFDEPTNDIDIETLEVLEDFIKKQTVPVIFISHDETFIENCANCILHFEQIKRKTQFKYTYYKGPFKEYVEKRKRAHQKQDQIAKFEETQYKTKMETIERLINAGAGDKVVRRLLSQKERLEKKGLPDYVDIESAIGLFFNEIDLPKGKVVCDIADMSVGIDGKSLIDDVNLNIVGPQKVVIVGSNGTGKTTLLREIYRNISEKTGIKIGYMPQNYQECMDMDSCPIDFLCSDGTKEQKTYCYTLMGISKFTSEEMTHKISDLSGGQQAKLYLIKMIKDNCNVLILDEPTRNLSPTSNPVIREILKDFGGAIISVSHDRKYIKEVCDEVYEVKNGSFQKKTDDEELIR